MTEQSKLYTNKHRDKIWYLPSKGIRYWHRMDGPAIEFADGTQSWYVNGKLHRTDGPAAERINGTKEWFVNGRRHRTDGPAITLANGTQHWYVNNKLHRTDGPAVDEADGYKLWWINGKDITKEVVAWIKKYKIDMDTDEGKMRFKLVWA